MNLLHKLLSITLGLLALVGGLAAVVVSLVPELWDLVTALLTRSRVGVWALVIALAGLTQLMTGKARRARPLVVSNVEGGTVSVNAQAIRDVILRLAPEFPGIVRMDPAIRIRNGVVWVNVGVTVRESPAVQSTCELLQHRLRERLIAGLGLSQVGEVSVGIKKFIPGEKPT